MRWRFLEFDRLRIYQFASIHAAGNYVRISLRPCVQPISSNHFLSPLIKLVVLGMPTKEITSVLGTSEITAKVHRGQVMHKMKAKSLVELGRLAEKLKISTIE
jgi:hypothetical protein